MHIPAPWFSSSLFECVCPPEAYYQYQQQYGIGVHPSSLHECVSNPLIHDCFITTIICINSSHGGIGDGPKETSVWFYGLWCAEN